MAKPIITLTTDFGVDSPYVAQMKGVILSICPDVTLVDISHAIKPQYIREAALVLSDVTPRFPAGSIHMAVVDPGVGTARQIVYAEIGDQRYVAPDNGLLSHLAAGHRIAQLVSLQNESYWLSQRSNTFHGRDIMAPVAAHLANGLDPTQLGSPINNLVMLPWNRPRRSSTGVLGEILMIDSFGNAITNIGRGDLEAVGNLPSLIVDCCGRKIRGIVPAYGAALDREIVALIDSQGRLEIAVVGGSAAEALRLAVGEPVQVIQP
jgi:S-adenosyl-L-methionine hydrolase (adenosine-forming)